MTIHFENMTKTHLPLWFEWAQIPHVKNSWFKEGYEPKEKITEKIKGNGYDYPFIIYDDEVPIGFIQTSDLYQYRKKCNSPKGLFTHEDMGTYCVDLFIAEEENLNKGIGTSIMKAFVSHIFDTFNAKVILIDPFINNKRAIRCYEKTGFIFDKIENDGITDCYIMKLLRPAIS